MAYQDTSGLVAGTQQIWSDSGNTNMALNGLASQAGRTGAKSSTLIVAPPGGTTAQMPELLEILLLVQYSAAPTAGSDTADLYLSFSDSATAGTNNEGFTSASGGADAALGNKDQLPNMTFCGSSIASNSIGGSADQNARFLVKPKREYFSPVLFVNTASVTLKASANVSKITVTPWFRERQS